LSPGFAGKGRFEFGFHYSGWSVNILKGIVEDAADFEDLFFSAVEGENDNVMLMDYEQSVEFDSGGSNFGFEFRWYPKGYEGSFSLGLAVEKTTMKIGPMSIDAFMIAEEQISDWEIDTYQFDAEANADLLYKPLAFLMNVRWDIKRAWRVHPVITFGLGFAGVGSLKKAVLSYSLEGTLTGPDETETINESDEKTLQELMDEAEEDNGEGEAPTLDEIPFIPFIQLLVGIKGEITKNIYLMLDGGIFDGFVIRGGIAVRF
jgi:hypothetical protein